MFRTFRRNALTERVTNGEVCSRHSFAFCERGKNMEIWKDIPGYEGLYQASNMGRIRSLKFRHIDRIHIMCLGKRTDGYLCVGLSKNGKVTSKTVHRLVALTFLPNPNGYEMVNHKDENKRNNRVDNLEWCTRSYNQVYSMNLHEERRKVFGNNFRNADGTNSSPFTKRGVAHTHFRKVKATSLDGTFCKVYENAAVAAVELGIKRNGNIISTCKANARTDRVRKRKRGASSHGYIWEWV